MQKAILPLVIITAGAHKLTIENHHLSPAGVYLINAECPKSNKIQITRQIRNENQTSSEIGFSLQPSGSS